MPVSARSKSVRMEMSRTIRQARSLVTDVAAGEDNSSLQGNERNLLGEIRERLEMLERSLLK